MRPLSPLSTSAFVFCALAAAASPTGSLLPLARAADAAAQEPTPTPTQAKAPDKPTQAKAPDKPTQAPAKAPARSPAKAQKKPEPPAELPRDTGPTPARIVDSISKGLEKTVGPDKAERLYCQLLAAGAAGGKAVLTEIPEVAPIQAMLTQIAEQAGDKGPMVNTIVEVGFPQALIDSHQRLWRKKGHTYVAAWAVVAAAIDEIDGTLYAADPQRRLYSFDSRAEQWRKTNADHIRAIQASGGTLYYLGTDNNLYSDTLRGKTRLREASPTATLLVTQGVLYLLDKGGLYQYSGGRWERGGAPVRTGITAFAATGSSYYALDDKGDLYAGADKKPIQQKQKGASLFTIGNRLLVLPPPPGRLRGYLPDQKTWQDLR